MTSLAALTASTPNLPCRTTPDPFFSDHPMDRQYAASLCTTCPLLLACAQYAIETGEAHGVWGGLDLDARERGCGTTRGFFSHAGRSETPCPPCRAAQEEAVLADRRRQLAAIHAKGGSVWGATLHRKFGERACDACRAAVAEANARRQQRDREADDRARAAWDARKAAEELRGAHAGVQPVSCAA